jgi:hypothetical protein
VIHPQPKEDGVFSYGLIKEKVKKAPTTGLFLPSDNENTNSKVVELKYYFIRSLVLAFLFYYIDI